MTKKNNPDVFRPIDVPERLKPYVRRVLVADSKEPVDISVNVCATGYHYFGWVWRGRWQGVVGGKALFDTNLDGPVHFSGQVDKGEVAAKIQGDIGQIFLEFTALGHFQLLGITGAKMLENAVAPHVLNPALKPHLEKMVSAGELSVNARLELIVGFLSQLPKNVVSDKMVAAVERIEAADGDIRIADLTTELDLAERQFRADFKTLIGLTPKAFCKALQITQALNHLLLSNGGDLAGVAAETGFSDQAHFTRAFRGFLGKAPGEYLKNVEATLARFAGQSRQ